MSKKISEDSSKKKGGRILRARGKTGMSTQPMENIDVRQLSEWVDRTEVMIQQLSQASTNTWINLRGTSLNVQALLNALLAKGVLSPEEFGEEICRLQKQIDEQLARELNDEEPPLEGIEGPPSLPEDDDFDFLS